MRSSGADGAAALRRAPDHRGTGRSLSFGTFVLWGAWGISLLLVGAFLVGPLPRLVPFLVFLPAIVASVGTVGQTAVISVWVLLVAVTAFAYHNGITGVDVYLLMVTAGFGAVSVAACRYRIRHNEEAYRLRFREEEVRRLRSTVAELQRRILRPLPARVEGIVVEGRYRPIEEDRMVGGDIYEVVRSPRGVRVLVADVQGKGLPAVGTAFSVLGAFRSAAYRKAELSEVVDVMEDAVVHYNSYARQIEEPERFVTALVLGLDRRGRVRVVNCGHVPPYLVGPGRVEVATRAESGTPLGLGGLLAEPRVIEEFDLPPHTALVMCTDGVTEARNRDGEFYPLAQRLSAWQDVPPERIIETLAADLSEFTGGCYRDDVTALTLYREAEAAPAAKTERAAG